MSVGVGHSVKRVDGFEKVTGRARYTDDFFEGNMYVAKVLHSTIANGYVKSIDTSEAEKIKGVVKIVTCFDVPDISFPTAGHPWSTDPHHQDAADRKLLNTRVRFYGDDIAAVIAEDEVAAKQALAAMKVEYEELTPVITMEDALKEGAIPVQESHPDNIFAHSSFELGDYEEEEKKCEEAGVKCLEGNYIVPRVQHCHIETPISYAYMEKGRVTVVTSTQIPHIVRRVVGQALGIPWGKVRIIKPYVGGGFGNKQDVLYEPLTAYLSTVVGGRCVKLDITREETFVNTRSRHYREMYLKTYVADDGTFLVRDNTIYSNNGAYGSHGHATTANGSNAFRHIYQTEKACRSHAYTIHTNTPTCGAMRAYGIPEITWAMECHVDDICQKFGFDPIEIRLKNMMPLGYIDPLLGIKCNSTGLKECIEKGRQYIDWDKKREEYKNQTGDVRHGVGMAIFSYKTGVHPIALETAGCRLVMNQDGSVQMQMGATEIGQGADTAFSQMVSEVLSIPVEDVHAVSTQDTDITPFDTGAYASRQTYVSGMACKKAAIELREKVLDYAEYMVNNLPQYKEFKGLTKEYITIVNGEIKSTEFYSRDKVICPLSELAFTAQYDLNRAGQLTADVNNQCKTNTFSFGCTFAEVTVDIPVGKVTVDNIINVHDCGRLINPQLASMQVHGGMSMSLGYALSEQMLTDPKTGRILNGNLLDYKLPTTMDTPHLEAQFVEAYDPSAPFGNKSLGEPPAISPAPAVRNAILNATGVAFNEAPMTPQRLVEKFMAEGLIK